MVRAVNAGGEAESIADFAVIEAHPDRMIEINKTVVFDGLPMIKVMFCLFCTLFYTFVLF
jgi:hypothetical protein